MKPLYKHKLPIGEFHLYAEKPHEACYPKQIHSNHVVFSHELSVGLTQADGTAITWNNLENKPSLRVLSLTADCLPVLVLGKEGMALLHAGWKGVQKKIVLSPAVHQIQPFYFFIGPSIQAKSFQVTQEFKDYFPNSANFISSEKGLFFNLQQEVTDQIKHCFPSSKVENCAVDTFTDPSLQSYRRQKGLQSSNWNTYVYKE
jgi:copper oxidase (laccase) domain-containing protein